MLASGVDVALPGVVAEVVDVVGTEVVTGTVVEVVEDVVVTCGVPTVTADDADATFEYPPGPTA